MRVLPVAFRRSAKHLAPRRRRTALLAAGALAVPMLLVALPQGPASANITGSTFDAGDGNLVLNDEALDWQNAPNFAFGDDKSTGKSDDSFKGGVNEDTVNPAVGFGAIPNSKDDLNRFYVSFEKSSADQRLLYLAWIRNKTSGSADMDFELNQEDTANTSDGLPLRRAGDLLVTYEFISTKSPTIRLQRWSTTPGAACVAASAAPCWADRVELSPANSEAAVNDGVVVTDPRRNNARLASQTFGEAAINLTALNVFTAGTCTRFARVFAKTRSSQSFNSSLQDYIKPININFSNCATKTFNVTMTSGVPTGLTPYVVYTIGSTTTSTPLTQSGSTSTWTGSNGSIPPGSTLTGLHLELRTAAGGLAWRSADSANETISGDKTNTGTFSYRVTLTPDSAENFVNRPHPLTATVLGKGSLNGVPANPAETPIVGVPVRFATFGGTPTGCGSLSPTSATTGSAGTAQTTLTSASACSTSIRAWVDNVGGTPGTFDSAKDTSATATKTFVAYDLDVSPSDATNALGTNHRFIITLTRDEGSGPVGYSGETVTFSLGNAAATGAHLVSVNGTTTSGTSGSCTTTANGTCTVFATATKTGTFTLDAVYAAVDDVGTVNIGSRGTKSYVDYRINVTPPSARNEVGVPHTFTVTLQRDTGSGFTGLAGQTVDLVLSTTAGDVHYSSINGTPSSGTGTKTCTTSATGTCLVTVTATTPGLATLAASFSTLLDSGPFTTQPASGTKQYSKFGMTVTPLTAVNQLGEPHTFTVTLTADDGAGPYGFAGETVGLSLDIGATDGHFTAINGQPASGTTGSCVTGTDGTCAVTIVSSLPGTIVLTASWEKQIGDGKATLSRTATKRYLDLQVSKTSCAAAAPVGGLLRFDIPYSVKGTALTNVVITDNLPAGLGFVSASPAATSSPVQGSTGTVTWQLGTVAENTTSLVSLVVVVLQPGTQVNSGTLTADGGVSKTFAATVTGSNTGAAASGRAYGIEATLLGTNLVPPTPDTDATNPDSLTSVPIPGLAPTVLSGRVGLLDVSNAPIVTATGAADEAVATVANVDLNVAGVSIKAKAVQARSESLATGSFAGTSTAGSEVVDLQINGGNPIDVSSPTVLPVITTGSPLAPTEISISVLEPTGATGAAVGGTAGRQPQNGLFSSGLTVNGLHIRATQGSSVLADVIVSSAKSLASFPTLTPCAGTGPYLVGQAYVAKKDLTAPAVTVGLPVGLVTLPSVGGSVSRTLNTADLSALGATAGTGETSTVGSLSGMRVDSDAIVQRLKANLGGALPLIEAGLVRAHASVNSPTPSNAEIARLSIAGMDVCAALAALPFPPPTGSGSVCYPAPNTKLLDATGLLKIVLNEQTTSGGVITVNAVHIYVLGAGNPLGLPAGADLVISSATAGTGS